MTEIFLMETLAAFVEEHTKDIILEVETEPGADRKERPAEIHKYGLKKKEDKIKRIPYVLLQLLKLCQAKLEQVQFNVCLDLRTLDFVAGTDLISIFGNAVDNALEAVRKLPPGAERIILLKSSRFANAVILRFGNPYTGKLCREGSRLLTGKADQDQHGIGLKSITRAVERYGGSVDVETSKEELWFELTIMIPLP